MEIKLAETASPHFVEGVPDQPFLRDTGDVSRLIEACFSNRITSALLYAPNLPARFFDLSSGEAGAILQKLRTYRIRLAVVCPPGTVKFSSRFGEMATEESRTGYFNVFESTEKAREWLSAPDHD